MRDASNHRECYHGALSVDEYNVIDIIVVMALGSAFLNCTLDLSSEVRSAKATLST